MIEMRYVRRRATRRALAVAVAVGAAVVAVGTPAWAAGGPPEMQYINGFDVRIPANIAVPDDPAYTNDAPVVNRIDRAEGDQVYTCTGGTWTFTEPRARSTGYGRFTHYRGPTWESTEDGSTVRGAVAAQADNGSGNIPLLLLRATATTDGRYGIFTRVRYVQRLDTHGGTTEGFPACTAELDGQTRDSHYDAVYAFYGDDGQAG